MGSIRRKKNRIPTPGARTVRCEAAKAFTKKKCGAAIKLENGLAEGASITIVCPRCKKPNIIVGGKNGTLQSMGEARDRAREPILRGVLT